LAHPESETAEYRTLLKITGSRRRFSGASNDGEKFHLGSYINSRQRRGVVKRRGVRLRQVELIDHIAVSSAVGKAKLGLGRAY
jgi:hypothetical protein